MDLFIRIRYSYDQLHQAIELIATKCASVVVYEHNEKSENIHIHALMKECSVSTDTLKNYVKKFIGSVPKTHWSFNKAVNDDCIRYMSKGKLDPVFVKNYDHDKIQNYKSEWKDYIKSTPKGMKQFVIKETAKESKLRQGEMIDECIKRLTVNGNKPRGREIVEMIRQVVAVENKTIIGRFKYRDYYDTIMARMEHTKNDFMFAVGAMCAKDFFAP